MTAISRNNLPKEPGRGPAIALAAMVHAALLGFLWVGIQWQNQESTAVEAEVWDVKVRDAAPLAPPPEPVTEPEPEKVKEQPKPVVKEEVKEDPEIAIEQEKKRKLEEKKKAEEKLKAEQEEAKRKAEREEELKKEKEKEKLAEQKKLEKEKADKEKADKLAAEKDKTKLDDAKKKDQALRDKMFAENMRRLNGQASNVGSGGSGTAAKSTGNNRGDPSWMAKVAQKIRSNSTFIVNDDSGNNPTVVYRIDLLPDGTLRGPIRKLKSSGVPGFDEAIERAIEKSQPIPRDSKGTVPDTFDLSYKMKE